MVRTILTPITTAAAMIALADALRALPGDADALGTPESTPPPGWHATTVQATDLNDRLHQSLGIATPAPSGQHLLACPDRAVRPFAYVAQATNAFVVSNALRQGSHGQRFSDRRQIRRHTWPRALWSITGCIGSSAVQAARSTRLLILA